MAQLNRTESQIPQILQKNHVHLLSEWLKEQAASANRQKYLMKEGESRNQSEEFLKLLQEAAQSEKLTNIDSDGWRQVLEFLDKISASRSLQGMTPSETAVFVFSLKRPLFESIKKEVRDAESLASEMWLATEMLDRLGLYTMEAYQKTREEVIHRQQQEMLELSTPVVTLWKGVLALPLIGTLDSTRTQVVMESLLEKIVSTGSNMAIIDITGVPTVDTLVAQHLLKTVTAARLMGAECIISGIRPQIAQTIVHLGVNMGDIATKANLADAFALALKRQGAVITHV